MLCRICWLCFCVFVLVSGQIVKGQDDPPPSKKETRQAKKAAKEEEKEKKLQAELQAKQQEAKERQATAQQAQQQQREWAAKLKAPVETKNSFGMSFVLIPPGGEEASKPFWLGKYEITQAEWPAGWTYDDFKEPPSRYMYRGEGIGVEHKLMKGVDSTRFPVEMSSWIMCVHFCNVLSRKEGLPPYYGLTIVSPGDEEDLLEGRDYPNVQIKILGGNGYRMPTNAEWVHAYNAGATTPFYFGSSTDDLGDYAWYRTNSDNRPHPVGEKKPNAFGLYDMAGNVGEWTQDLQPRTEEVNGRPVTKMFNVARGGSHLHPAGSCKASAVHALPDGAASWAVGIRLARTATPNESAAAPALDASRYYRIQFVQSKKVLAVGSPKADEPRVFLAAPDQADAGQQWKFVKAGNFYKVVNRQSGKALNVANASREQGAEIIQWNASNDAENQQWSLEKQAEHYVLKARHSDMAIDVERESKKRKPQVIQSPFHGDRSQIVELLPVKD